METYLVLPGGVLDVLGSVGELESGESLGIVVVWGGEGVCGYGRMGEGEGVCGYGRMGEGEDV